MAIFETILGELRNQHSWFSQVVKKPVGAFYVVATLQGNVKEAAEALNTPHGTVHSQLQQFEQGALPGIPLFLHPGPDNHFQPLIVTEHGKRLRDRLEGVFQTLLEISKEMDDSAEGKGGKITIGAFPSATLLYTAKLLHEIDHQGLDIEVAVHERGTADIFRMLAQCDIEIGIVRLPGPQPLIEQAHIASEVLYEEHAIIVTHCSHPFEAREDAISLQELAEEPLLLLDERQGTLRQLLNDRFQELNLSTKRIVCEGAEVHTLMQMVADNLGITIIPERSRRLAPHLYRKLAFKKIKGHPITLTTGIIWREYYDSLMMQRVRAILHQIEGEYYAL